MVAGADLKTFYGDHWGSDKVRLRAYPDRTNQIISIEPRDSADDVCEKY